MKTSRSIFAVSLLSLLLLPACGQQLVEFAGQGTPGGIAGFAGTNGNGGLSGSGAIGGGGSSSVNDGTAGAAGSSVNDGTAGAAGSSINDGTAGAAGSSVNDGTAGTAGSSVNSGNAGNAGSSADGGSAGTAGNSGIAGHAGAAGTPGAGQTVSQLAVPLGAASPFAILASAAITNIATSAIVGDIGLTPDAGSNISGFSSPLTCPEVTGTIYAVDVTGPACAVADPVRLTAAKADAEIAFTNARAAARGTPQAISGNLNGLTLYPGLYESGSSLQISPGGMLYLDAEGDGNAIFIIRSATSITTEATSKVLLTNGAKANNVYWTAGSAVTLGANSFMKGTVIAGTAIALLTGANLEGRVLNQGAAAAAITLDSCSITVPSH